MCLAIPAQVIEVDGYNFKAKVGNSETFVSGSTALLPEALQVDDYVIIHAGFALRKLDPLEAQESLKIFQDLAEALSKDNVATC